MNFADCANCLLHGWKKVEDLNTLQRCTRCKQIQYCGKECQAEHWKRIHQKQCRYFADPVKTQKWGHNEEACAICLQAAKVGKAEICRATNPNYECILKEKFPPHMYHPHPFPVTGQPGNTHEKGVIVLWQLLKKLELTQPGVIGSCRGKLIKVFAELKMIRLDIWKVRKILPKSECLGLKEYHPHGLDDLLETIMGKVGSGESIEDLVQIIQLVNDMLFMLGRTEDLQILQNPLADLPADLHSIVSQAMSNSTKFLAMANQVLDALTAQVVPYEDLVRIACGGSLEKRCTFCSQNKTVASIAVLSGKGSAVFFNSVFKEIYCCGAPNCLMEANSMMQDYIPFLTAVMTMVGERAVTRCDFCTRLPPSKEVHRCSKCLTVMYCSTTCWDQDRGIHNEFCREEPEERKKKVGSSGRRKEARDVVEQLEEVVLEELKKGTENAQLVQEACEVVTKFKLKGASKKAKR